MSETLEANTEPTTLSLAEKDDNLSVEVKTPAGSKDAEPNENVTEPIVETPLVERENGTKSEEIKIVAVASAVVDESINNEQEIISKSIKSINNTEPESSVHAKPSDDRNETRVISLDTIIRKGLNEQMPMTAKDIDNIVPNAIKQQQDANLKHSEKLASEREFTLVYESSDDYDSSDDKFEGESVADVTAQQTNEVERNVEPETSQTIEAKDSTNGSENCSAQSICETILEDKPSSGTTDSTTKELPVEGHVESKTTNSNESNDSTTSEHSFEDDGSESDSTQSSHKHKRKRRTETQTKEIKDDESRKTEEIGETGEDKSDDPGPRLNRRGKPRKSYDETDNEQVKKKVGRRMKIQRYAGPKRPGVRVSFMKIFSIFPCSNIRILCTFRDDRNVMTV